MISKLIELQARAKALDNRLKELDAIYRSGDEDIGRITRLKTSLESERVEILTALQSLLEENKMPSSLAEAVTQAQNPDGREQVKQSLEQIAKERGWGEKVLEQIKQYKDDILDLIISIAIKVAKELATGAP